MPDARCRICGEFKPLTSFPLNPRYLSGFDTRCRVCRALYNKHRYHNGYREKQIALSTAWTARQRK